MNPALRIDIPPSGKSTFCVFRVAWRACLLFDCRVSQSPSRDLVVDYFFWRAEDSHRNALNAHCCWLLHRGGIDAQKSTGRLLGLSVADKNELLFQRGINFNDLPAWQKRGVGVYWQSYEKAAFNPKLSQPVTALRRRLPVELALPRKDEYKRLLLERIDG